MEEEKLIGVGPFHPVYGDLERAASLEENDSSRWVDSVGQLCLKRLPEQAPEKPIQKKKSLFKKIIVFFCGPLATIAFGIMSGGIRVCGTSKEEGVNQVIDLLKQRGGLPQPKPRRNYWVD